VRVRLLNLLTLLSLLLCVAACVLWVRSYFKSDLIECEEPGESPFVIHGVWAARGSVYVVEDIRGMRDEEVYADAPLAVPTRRRWSLDVRAPERVEPYPGQALSLANRAGFFEEFGDAHGVRWAFPLWAVAVPALVLPTARLAEVWSQRRRLRAGRCPRCSYDLRATPGRCPECGSTPVSKVV